MAATVTGGGLFIMNLMNQRRDLQQAYELGMISKEQLQTAMSSPVFICGSAETYENFTDEEFEWISKNVMYDQHDSTGFFPRIVPFECLRIVTDKHRSYTQWWFDIENEEASCLYHPDKSVLDDLVSNDIDSVHFRFKIFRSKDTSLGRVWINKKQITAKEINCSGKTLTGVLGGIERDLVRFLFEVMSNSSTVLKVTDDQPGRSVQWHLNREHYVLINNHQAQTMQKKKRGIMKQDLVRGAHWRRSHLRRLMSDKFKHKKGLLVKVKKAWVGPLEWKGHDGKIYKVTEINSEKH